MPIIVTRDGKQYAGRDAGAAVDAMRDAGLFVRHETRSDYMRGVSDRLARLDGLAIRHDTAENFLVDLVAAGVITLGSLQ